MSNEKPPFVRACEIVGSQAEMARILNISPGMVNQVVQGKRPVPAEHCQAIQAATGGAITCRDLLPNDWQKYWPVKSQGKTKPAPQNQAEQGA